MKKILFGINKLGIGGAENVTIHQVNLIDKEKFDVYLGILYKTSQVNTLYDKIKIHPDKIVHFNFSNLFDLKASWRVYKFLKKNNIDIVSSGLFEANTVFRVAAFFAGTRVVLSTEHSSYYNKKFWQKKVDWFLSFLTDRIIAVSPQVAVFTSEQEGIAPSKFTVLNQISNFVLDGIYTRPEVFKRLQLPDDAFVAMTVGRLSPEKAQYRIIEIANKIVADFGRTNIHFVIVGFGPLEKSLREIIKEKKLEKYVKLAIDPKQAKEYLVAGDVFLLPSDREGMPVAMLEAMYNGLPSIASDVGGVSDVLNDGGGFLIEKANTDEMAAKVLWLSDHREEYLKMKEEAKKAALKNVGNIKDLEDIIDSLYMSKKNSK